MSKWIIKKTINESLRKNMILEETNLIHIEAINLSEYDGGFSFFSKGKNFKTENDTVIKLLGKKSEFDEYLQEYTDRELKTYRWKSSPIVNLFAGRTYKESPLSNFDRSCALDAGANIIFLEDGSEVVALRGSRKKFNECMDILIEDKPSNNELLDILVEDDKITKREYVTEIIKEEKLVGPAGPRGFPGEQGPVGDDGPAGPRGDRGDAGPRGEPGKDGTDGINGTDGSIGVTGPKGETGDRGERGEKGEQGIPGEVAQKGERGPTGPAGPKGDRGPLGRSLKGEKGEKGETGVTGPMGNTGSIGPIGPKGPRGTSVVGPEGPQGPEGPEGPQGPKGDDGESPVVKAKYPLVYNEDRKLFTIDKKFFEKLLSGGNVNEKMMNNFVTAAAVAGGGGLSSIKDGNNSDIAFVRNPEDLIFEGSGVSLNKVGGKSVRVSISGGGSAGSSVYVSDDAPSGTFVTGDRWIESDTTKLFTRYEDLWVEF